MSLKEYWEGLPKWAKIGIPVAGGAVILLGISKMKSGGTAVSANTTGAIQDGTTGGLTSASYDPASQTSALISSLQDTIAHSTETNLTSFQDDLQKQAAANAAAMAGFQSQIQALMGQIANIKAHPDPHTTVTTYASSPISSNTPSESGSHGSTDGPVSITTTNVNGTVVPGNYSNVDSHTHVVTAPEAGGTFVWNDQSGIALPSDAKILN